jgi:hypothetical protein
MSVVAWRLPWITYINRTNPQVSCVAVLATIEWQALYMRIHKTSILPKSPRSTYQAIRWIAQLGGFLGLRSDGKTGIVIIGRGWQRLQDFTATWELIVNVPTHLMGNI